MALLARHPIPLAVAFLGTAATAVFFALARPKYDRAGGGTTITLPAKRPANDAAGKAGWVWADGTPGWKAGERVQGFLVAGVQPVELQSTRLAAARQGLDAGGVRVLASIRGSERGPLAILATPTLYETPVRTCLAALLDGDRPVRWLCPGATPSPRDLEHSRVLVAATRYTWTAPGRKEHPLYLVGLARGDVRRVVLRTGGGLAPQPLYTRGKTWGQFDAAVATAPKPRLDIYDRRGLAETLLLHVAPGRERVLR